MDRKIEKKKWPVKRITLVVLSISIVFLVGLYLVRLASSSVYKIDVDRISVSSVRVGSFQDFIPFQGTILPKKVTFISTQQSGRVESIYVDDGALLEVGQPILELSNLRLQLDFISQEAQVTEQLNELKTINLSFERAAIADERALLESKYELQQATREYDRLKPLFESNAVSKQEFERVQDEFDFTQRKFQLAERSQIQQRSLRAEQLGQLQKSTKNLESNLEFARRAIDDLVVKAPVAGQLTGFDTEVGESKSIGDKLAEVHGVDEYAVRAWVDEYYLDRVDVGQSARYTLRGKEYSIRVEKTYPTITNGQFRVDFSFDSAPPEGVRSGQTLQLELVFGGSHETLLLTNGDFMRDTAGVWAFVLDKSGTIASKRQIKVGKRNIEYVEIESGVSEGERIIISSYSAYKDFDSVKVSR